jgi:hypothetical protein
MLHKELDPEFIWYIQLCFMNFYFIHIFIYILHFIIDGFVLHSADI